MQVLLEKLQQGSSVILAEAIGCVCLSIQLPQVMRKLSSGLVQSVAGGTPAVSILTSTVL